MLIHKLAFTHERKIKYDIKHQKTTAEHISFSSHEQECISTQSILAQNQDL